MEEELKNLANGESPESTKVSKKEGKPTRIKGKGSIITRALRRIKDKKVARAAANQKSLEQSQKDGARLDELQKIQAKALDEGDTKTAQDALREITEIKHRSPDAILHSTNMMRQEQTAAAQGRYSPLLQAALSAAGIGASLGQIQRSNSLYSSLIPPSIPTLPSTDPALNQQLFSAQRGTMNAGTAMAAANVGINDAYNQEVQEATNTAGGQAGMRQSLINEANLNKMRASVAMLPELDNIRAREEGRADQLASTRAELDQQGYSRQLDAATLAFQNYYKNAEAIGNLGAMGHSNLFGQLGDLSKTLIPATMAFSNPYKPQQNNTVANNPSLQQAELYSDHLNDNLKQNQMEDSFADRYKMKFNPMNSNG